MKVENLNALESTLLSKLNEGYTTFDTLKEVVPFNESTLKMVLETMTAKNILKFNTVKKEYGYDTPVSGEKVILDGNIALPTTIFRNENETIVSRGEWYKFPADFDVRRIIWNVALPNSNKSTLVDLIKESVLKVRKSKIEQLPEYKKLCGYIIPWSQNVLFEIVTVGSELTEVQLIFQDVVQDSTDKELKYNFRGFRVRTEISTSQLIDQLTCDTAERNFSLIEVSRLFNFSDFIFSNNEIPYFNDGNNIEYVKITGIRNKLELTYYTFIEGNSKKGQVESFIDVSEGIMKLRELFDGFAYSLLLNNDFLVEKTE